MADVIIGPGHGLDPAGLPVEWLAAGATYVQQIAPTESLYLASADIYIDEVDTIGGMTAVLYADAGLSGDARRPATLIARSQPGVGMGVWGWNTFAFSSGQEPALRGGRKYWVGFQVPPNVEGDNGGNLRIRALSSTPGIIAGRGALAADLPAGSAAPWPASDAPSYFTLNANVWGPGFTPVLLVGGPPGTKAPAKTYAVLTPPAAAPVAAQPGVVVAVFPK